MARISSEEAVEKIGNRFDLVLVASQRVREIKNGSMPMVDDKDSSPAIIALKEIEKGKYTKKDYLNKIPRKQKGKWE